MWSGAVLRLGLRLRRLIPVGEHAVDPADDGLAQERKLAAARPRWRRLDPAREVLADVGAPEPVDRLLRIADDEQSSWAARSVFPSPAGPPSGRGGEPHGELELDRLGVLELVEQHPGVPLMEAWRGRRAGAEQAAGEHEQVVELNSCRRPRCSAPSSTNPPISAPITARHSARYTETRSLTTARRSSMRSRKVSSPSTPSGDAFHLTLFPTRSADPILLSTSAISNSSAARQLIGERRQLVDVRAGAVAGRRTRRSGDVAELDDEVVRADDARSLGRGRDAVCHEVPVVVELVGDAVQPVEVQARVALGVDDEPAALWIVEERLEELGPPIVERHVASRPRRGR